MRRLSVTNLSLDNNLLMFRLSAPVIIRARDDKFHHDDDWRIHSKRLQVIVQAQVGNLFFSHLAKCIRNIFPPFKLKDYITSFISIPFAAYTNLLLTNNIQ